jgi:valyl-tRNA synthetase
VAEVTGALEEFAFSKAANALYAFFWDDFCAWTIELSKPRLAGGNTREDKQIAQAVLLHVLDRSLRLLHPFCPFITEVLWAELAKVAPPGPARSLGKESGGEGELLVRARWPEVSAERISLELEARFAIIFEAVRAVRNIRQKNQIKPGLKLRVFIEAREASVAERLRGGSHILSQMANIEPATIAAEVVKPRPAGHELLADADLYVDLAGLIDVSRERERLSAELARAENAVTQSAARLADASFLKNAPPDKVKAERARLGEYQEKAEKLRAALGEIG